MDRTRAKSVLDKPCPSFQEILCDITLPMPTTDMSAWLDDPALLSCNRSLPLQDVSNRSVFDDCHTNSLVNRSQAVTTNFPIECYLDDDTVEHSERDRRRDAAFKTQMCSALLRTGACAYGPVCRFAHNYNELRPPHPSGRHHPKYKTQICLNFLHNGFCRYGAHCQFIHRRPDTAASAIKSTNIWPPHLQPVPASQLTESSLRTALPIDAPTVPLPTGLLPTATRRPERPASALPMSSMYAAHHASGDRPHTPWPVDHRHPSVDPLNATLPAGLLPTNCLPSAPRSLLDFMDSDEPTPSSTAAAATSTEPFDRTGYAAQLAERLRQNVAVIHQFLSITPKR